MRAAKTLIREGKLDPTVSDEALSDVGGACVAVTLGRLFSSDEDATEVLRQFIRAVGRIAGRNAAIATAMLGNVCFLGPADAADSIRRLVHDDQTDGAEEILKLDVSKTALKKAEKVAL